MDTYFQLHSTTHVTMLNIYCTGQDPSYANLYK